MEYEEMKQQINKELELEKREKAIAEKEKAILEKKANSEKKNNEVFNFNFTGVRAKR